jgi:hypothetical protein
MPFLLIAGIMCAAPIKVDAFNRPWTENDEWVMQSAINGGCKARYGERSPCLRKIVKLKAFQDYYLECGAELK